MTLSVGRTRFSLYAGVFALLALMSQIGQAAPVSSISVTPADPTINATEMQAFTATGNLSDGTTRALSSVSALSAADWHACALLSSGGVRCWGRNDYGQLGDGTNTDSFTPVDVLAIDANSNATTATAVAAGYLYTCALMQSGAVQCWGHNDYGQLGDGSVASSSTPVPVSGIDGTTARATAVSAWNLHSCALLDTGAVQCWGDNDYGALGLGSYAPPYSATPLTVPAIDGNIAKATSIGAGYYFTCAALTSGIAQCWGWNAYGQLGNGSTTDALSPVTVSTSGAVTAVATGGYHACALLASGNVACWGANNYGQLGNGSVTDSSVPVAVSGIDGSSDPAVAISVGSYHSCALLQSGTVKCWGRNDDGQVGNASTTDALTAQTVSGIDGTSSVATALTAGGFFSCALLDSGDVRCWGGNYYGLLGDGTNMNSSVPIAFTQPLGVSWQSSDTSVATIDGTGVATGVAAGTATITASFGGISQATTLTVLSAPTGGTGSGDTGDTGSGGSDTGDTGSDGGIDITVTKQLLKNLAQLVQQVSASDRHGHWVKRHLKHEVRKLWHALKPHHRWHHNHICKACRIVDHFVRDVSRQSGRHLTVDDANALIAAAMQLKAALPCGVNNQTSDDDD